MLNNDNNNKTEEVTNTNKGSDKKQKEQPQSNDQWSTFDSWESSMDSAIGGWGNDDQWK